MKIKELIFGNYDNEDDYIPSIFARLNNKMKRHCSCGLFKYCIFDYCFPSKSERDKFKLVKDASLISNGKVRK